MGAAPGGQRLPESNAENRPRRLSSVVCQTVKITTNQRAKCSCTHSSAMQFGQTLEEGMAAPSGLLPGESRDRGARRAAVHGVAQSQS